MQTPAVTKAEFELFMSKISKIFDARNTLSTLATFALLVACDAPSKAPAPSSDLAHVAAGADDELRAPETPPKDPMIMHPQLQSYIADVVTHFDAIAPERKQQLEKLALFIESKRSAGETAKITYICTHNSRRSHMGQLWAAAAAAYYGLQGVQTFSGGTEATAFNPRAVAALQRAGFEIGPAEPEGDNPHYEVTFAEKGPKLEAFSKRYEEEPNPQQNFAAVMTCTQADKNCPIVAGASLRIPLPYEDPKESDETPQESEIYDLRAKQIATEMFYLFSRVRA